MNTHHCSIQFLGPLFLAGELPGVLPPMVNLSRLAKSLVFDTSLVNAASDFVSESKIGAVNS